MLLGARQECVAGGIDIGEKMLILRRFGYDFLELSLTREEIASLTPESASIYQSAIAQTELAIRSISMGHFGGFAARPLDERAEIIQHIQALVDFTAAIGADTILLATREEMGTVDKNAEIYDQALRSVADKAAAAGVTLALEHVGWYKPYLLAGLIQALNHPAISLGQHGALGRCDVPRHERDPRGEPGLR